MFIIGLTGGALKVVGQEISCTDAESTLGQMDGATMVNISRTKSTDLASTCGQILRSMKVTGKMESNKVKENSRIPRVSQELVFGKTENG